MLIETHFLRMTETIHTTIDHVFRNEYVKLTSSLTSKFGTSKIDLIEDAIQESLLKAVRIWSFQEIPPNPGKWLYRVSHNHIIDTLRRQSKTVMFNPEIMNDYVTGDFEMDDDIEDNQLKMIFACCHPQLKEGEQIMISLKLLCGFGNKEIASALLRQPEAVKKAITRAKQKFKTKIGSLEIPKSDHLKERLEGVLRVIYLLFNSGYTAHSGEMLLKKDVCEDALRLAGILHKNTSCNTPELRALISLMCYQLSRFDARVDKGGKMVIFENQDRSLWDKELILLGSHFLANSQNASPLSSYRYEAAIAREYAISTSFETVNWNTILIIYTAMETHSNSIVHHLNKLVIVSKVHGTRKALDQLLLLDEEQLTSNYLYYSIKSNFQKQLGIPDYKTNLEKAINLTDNQLEKEFLKTKY